MLALLDVPAQLFRLLERDPERAGKPLRLRRCPEHQDVDTVVGYAVVPQRPPDSARGVLGIPGLEPRPHAAFQLFDDAVRNARVNIGASNRWMLPGLAISGRQLAASAPRERGGHGD